MSWLLEWFEGPVVWDALINWPLGTLQLKQSRVLFAVLCVMTTTTTSLSWVNTEVASN